MTKREICERLMNLYEGVCRDAGKEDSYSTDRAKLALRVAGNLRDLLLDLAAPEAEEEKEAAFRERCRAVLGDIASTGKKEPEKWPHVRTCNDKFAFTHCYCGGKAYVKMRVSEGEAFVAKCAKCGDVLQGVPDWRIDWTNDPPPENLFAEEKPKSEEPPLLIYEENGEKVPCPVCGAPAAPIKNKPGVFLCKRCGGLVCAQEGEK